MTLVDFLQKIKANLEKKKDADALFFYDAYIDSVELIKEMRKTSNLPNGFHVRNMGDNKEYWCLIYELIILVLIEYGHKNASEANKDIYEIIDRISLAIWEELVDTFLIKTHPIRVIEAMERLVELGLAKKENWSYVATEAGLKKIEKLDSSFKIK